MFQTPSHELASPHLAGQGSWEDPGRTQAPSLGEAVCPALFPKISRRAQSLLPLRDKEHYRTKSHLTLIPPHLPRDQTHTETAAPTNC